MITHGHTGLLCANERDLMNTVRQLLESEQLRTGLGLAARLAAYDRFQRELFQRRLLAAYAIGPARPYIDAGVTAQADDGDLTRSASHLLEGVV
jgi:hypothetical protein